MFFFQHVQNSEKIAHRLHGTGIFDFVGKCGEIYRSSHGFYGLLCVSNIMLFSGKKIHKGRIGIGSLFEVDKSKAAGS